MKALIFAAGLGTRLRPLTDITPKALLKVDGKPMLEYQILKLKEAGFTTIAITVSHLAEQIVEFLKENDNFGLDIRISDETDLLRDTGGGIRHVSNPLYGLNADQWDDSKLNEEPFLLHNVDIFSNLDLRKFYEENRSDKVISTLLVSDRVTNRYLLFDDDSRLVGWTNIETGEVKSPFGKINPDDYRKLAFDGIHLISPKIFPLMASWPEKFPIFDFYLSIAAEHIVRGVVVENLKIVDIGKKETLENFNINNYIIG